MIVFADRDGCPLERFHDSLDRRADACFRVLIEQLAERGGEVLRKPLGYDRDSRIAVRYERDGVHGLRLGQVTLFAFVFRRDIVLLHGVLIDVGTDPANADLELAVERLNAFLEDPPGHTAEF